MKSIIEVVIFTECILNEESPSNNDRKRGGNVCINIYLARALCGYFLIHFLI